MNVFVGFFLFKCEHFFRDSKLFLILEYLAFLYLFKKKINLKNYVTIEIKQSLAIISKKNVPDHFPVPSSKHPEIKFYSFDATSGVQKSKDMS